MAEFPTKAKVVIIGLGGIVGASIAHHLIERGWDDIVGIDKSGIPTDIGSTAHASDFCYTTSHDYLSVWTTQYSIDFFEKMGHYARIGGLEVARTGDETWMEEIRRKVTSARAFGTRAHLVTPDEIKAKFPLIEQDQVMGGMFDPDAGLVIPRSQTVAGKLVDAGEKSGKAQGLRQYARQVADRRGRPHQGCRHPSRHHRGGSCHRLRRSLGPSDRRNGWRGSARHAGRSPADLLRPYNEFEGTGKEIGYPLLRDQGNSAYMRDTGDPKTTEAARSSGAITKPTIRACVIRASFWRSTRHASRLRSATWKWTRSSARWKRPSNLRRSLASWAIMRAIASTACCRSLLPVAFRRRKPEVRGLWYCVAIWVKDGPGYGKLIADWLTDGRTEIDHASIDYSRFYPHQLEEKFYSRPLL